MIKEVANLLPGQNMLLLLKSEIYQETLPNMVKYITNQMGWQVVYVSITKPAAYVQDNLKNQGVKSDKISYVECSELPSIKDSTSPSHLTGLNILIEQKLKATEGEGVVLFDTLTALNTYNSDEMITHYINHLSKRAKIDRFRVIWVFIKKLKREELDPVILTSVDKIVK